MSEQPELSDLFPPGFLPVRRRRREVAQRLVIPVSPYVELVLLMPSRILEPDEWARMMDILCAMKPGLVYEDEEAPEPE